MVHKDYAHRDLIDKLGIKPGHAVAFDDLAWSLDELVRQRILARTGRGPVSGEETADVVLVTVDAATDATATLQRWKPRLHPAGGVWLLSPKRGQPGFIDQRVLIAAGLAAGLVDNKSCSVSGTISALRMVIRKVDRPTRR